MMRGTDQVPLPQCTLLNAFASVVSLLIIIGQGGRNNTRVSISAPRERYLRLARVLFPVLRATVVHRVRCIIAPDHEAGMHQKRRRPAGDVGNSLGTVAQLSDSRSSQDGRWYAGSECAGSPDGRRQARPLRSLDG